MNTSALSVAAILYLGALAYLGFRGYRATHSTSDYLVAGRRANPVVMALSYGATFISTSAIVGFGGAAAVFGMGLLWLTVLNILVGVFVAFVVFGRRVRRMGHRLQAHTFPELLGKRFNSRFIQAFSGLIILLFMPLYSSAVLIAAARYIEMVFHIDYGIAVTIYSLIIAGYVIAGGLKGVMYTDALQGFLMFVGMAVLCVFTYGRMGGLVEAHRRLDALPAQVDTQYQEVLPRLRAMAPPDASDGEVFAWLSENAYELSRSAGMDDAAKAELFARKPELEALGGLMREHPCLSSKLALAALSKGGFRGWTRMPAPGSSFFYQLVTSIIMGVGIGVLAQPQLVVRFMTVKSNRELNRAVLVGGIFILSMTGVAFVVGNLSNVWFAMPEHGGKIALAMAPGGNIDLIVPAFIDSALPEWFGALFMLTMLSAAMSTQSSQFHAMGTSIGRDFYERGILGSTERRGTVFITRVGILIGILATVLLSFSLPEGIVAAATAIFFGLCAAAFLPMYVGALFWKRMTRAGAIASLCVGFGASFFWLTFVQMPRAMLPAILANVFLGKPTLLPGPILGIHWNWVEALCVALPLSTGVAVAVSLLTRPEPREHIAFCFGEAKARR